MVKPVEARTKGKNGKNILRLCLISIKIRGLKYFFEPYS
jgi:hypothetical protein